jgi:VIT1/CCC1 family predicted Fe2+/Mn2+ transporter
MKAHEVHPRPTLLSDFILGSQDGLVNVLGILLGLVIATHDTRVIFVAALAALAAESISMGAVAYTSTRARYNLYRAERERELEEMRDLPDAEREEIRVIFRKWGFEGAELEELVRKIESKPAAMLEMMMAFELHLAPIPADQPRRSATIVFLATVFGSLIPLLPFVFLSSDLVTASYVSIAVSGAMLFAIGWYEAKTNLGITWEGGLRMLLIGLGAGFGGFAAGFLSNHFAGVSPT